MIALLTPLLVAMGPLALFLVVAIVFAETGLLVGFLLPGDGLLFTVGVLVAGHQVPLPLWLVALGCVVAAVVGDQAGYSIGRRIGPRLFTRADSRFFNPHHVDKAHAFFDKHGPKAVVLARFVPWARTFTPAVAGIGQMPRRSFTVYNVVGGAVWVFSLLGIGYALGGVPLVAEHLTLLTLGLVSLSVVPASILAVRRRLSGARAPRTALVPRPVPAAP